MWYLLATTQDYAVLISAISGAIVAIIGAFFAGLAAYRGGQIHTQVQTGNSTTLGHQVQNIANTQDTVAKVLNATEKT